jgi:hypothetical protein
VKEVIRHAVGNKNFNQLRNSFGNPREKQTPPFWYEIFRSDQRWLRDISDILNSYPSLRAIIDVQRSNLFLSNFQAGHLQSQDYAMDAKIFARLATICLAFENLGLR